MHLDSVAPSNRVGTGLRSLAILLATVCSMLAAPVKAGPTYISGHISNITFAGDSVLIMIDAGLPDNCAGTSYGWMKIPPEYKSMTSFVLGLWMRGDESQVYVSVYTEGLVSGYCRISQIDPEN